jgi:hypothetical protein
MLCKCGSNLQVIMVQFGNDVCWVCAQIPEYVRRDKLGGYENYTVSDGKETLRHGFKGATGTTTTTDAVAGDS